MFCEVKCLAIQNTCQGQHELHKLNVVRIKTQQITNTASTFFYNNKQLYSQLKSSWIK